MRGVQTIVAGFAAALASAPVAQAGWLQYESPEYGFSALFPRTPTRQERTTDDIIFTSFKAGNDAASCFVVVAQYQRAIDPNKEATAIRDASLKAMKATQTASKRSAIMRGGEQLEALEFEAASDERSFRSLIVTDGQRGYQVFGGVSKIDGDTAELDACVGGFRLLPKA